MWQVLAQLVPLAVAAAISMVPITVAVFILLSGRSRVLAPPFLLGWMLGTASALTIAVVAAQALPGRQRQRDQLIVDLEIAIGCGLVVLGTLTLVRHRRAPATRPPGWIEGIGSFGPLPALGIGLALNLRPKAVLLVSAAGLAITRARLAPEEAVVGITVYTVIATSTVAAPILATLFFPERMEPHVVAARDWITAHGGALTAAIMILIGVLLAAAGLSV